ncbi:hypothetical protein BJY54_000157 [Streptomyces nodosus]|uniref:hypothetical protein n=1 Tax=Streptomyces nodosus TaxID=40318 RepID=UPI00123DCA16|nr:hypothetical protein [Streptomyces nodosus]MBB4789545.1 hypothetical protein [Streptomyces nodosus]
MAIAQRGGRGLAVTATIAGFGLLATACSSNHAISDDVTPPALTVSPTAPVSGYDGLSRAPLSSYGTSEQDSDLLFETRKALIIRCMKGRGNEAYSGQNIIRVAVKGSKEALRPAGAWGYIGRGTAEHKGFHTAIAAPDRVGGGSGYSQKDFQACSVETNKLLPTLAETDGWKLTQALFNQSFQQTAADKRVVSARNRWATCMAAAGHPARDPEELAAGPWDTAQPTADEIAAATAAESCTAYSHLAAVYFAVLTGYQRQLISANSVALNVYQKQVDENVGKAALLLVESSGSAR